MFKIHSMMTVMKLNMITNPECLLHRNTYYMMDLGGSMTVTSDNNGNSYRTMNLGGV